MRCPKCKKLLRENTYGNKLYCQGHSLFDDVEKEFKEEQLKKQLNASKLSKTINR